MIRCSKRSVLFRSMGSQLESISHLLHAYYTSRISTDCITPIIPNKEYKLQRNRKTHNANLADRISQKLSLKISALPLPGSHQLHRLKSLGMHTGHSNCNNEVLKLAPLRTGGGQRFQNTIVNDVRLSITRTYDNQRSAVRQQLMYTVYASAPITLSKHPRSAQRNKRRYTIQIYL